MKRIARRESPKLKKYRRETGSSGRSSGGLRGNTDTVNARDRHFQQSAGFDRRNRRPGDSPFRRSARDFSEHGHRGSSRAFPVGNSNRRFPLRNFGLR